MNFMWDDYDKLLVKVVSYTNLSQATKFSWPTIIEEFSVPHENLLAFKYYFNLGPKNHPPNKRIIKHIVHMHGLWYQWIWTCVELMRSHVQFP